MIGVLIVGAHHLVRGGVAALIAASADCAVAGEAGTEDEAVALAAARRPDVILIDTHLPVLDGIGATRRIRAAATVCPPRVLLLTTVGPDEYVCAAVRVGVSGLLLKEASPQQVLTAIRAVATGCMVIAPPVTRRWVETSGERGDADIRPSPKLEGLTTRETEVLRLVGVGMSNTEIASRLSVSASTVKTHLHHVMAKLGVGSRAQAVVVAYESGLVTPRRESGGRADRATPTLTRQPSVEMVRAHHPDRGARPDPVRVR
ncbi:response regulator transcription factor [Nocardia sp. CDC159]|nr:response regulator transcription factor [Nocardia sp. CDC159]